mmetsp:Transcript_53140/g.153366  ORF Transcript_53140/g.153366 Transcript_53140/m.153366 type:complete len:293 (+) Transcript_53140:1903-2781(+)
MAERALVAASATAKLPIASRLLLHRSSSPYSATKPSMADSARANVPSAAGMDAASKPRRSPPELSAATARLAKATSSVILACTTLSFMETAPKVLAAPESPSAFTATAKAFNDALTSASCRYRDSILDCGGKLPAKATSTASNTSQALVNAFEASGSKPSASRSIRRRLLCEAAAAKSMREVLVAASPALPKNQASSSSASASFASSSDATPTSSSPGASTSIANIDASPVSSSTSSFVAGASAAAGTAPTSLNESLRAAASHRPRKAPNSAFASRRAFGAKSFDTSKALAT